MISSKRGPCGTGALRQPPPAHPGMLRLRHSKHGALRPRTGRCHHGPYRANLKGLAGEVASGEQSALLDSRSTLRGLLRVHRDQASQYLNGLREELGPLRPRLGEIMETMAQGDDDHREAFRQSIARLREVAALPEARPVSAAVVAATEAVERQVERIREQSQLLVAQFQVEIRMLHPPHRQPGGGGHGGQHEQAAQRAEMERRIGGAGDEWFSLLVMRVEGLRLAERQWGETTAAELAGALGKRLRSGLPPEAVIGRWSHEDFIAKVTLGGPKRWPPPSGSRKTCRALTPA